MNAEKRGGSGGPAPGDRLSAAELLQSHIAANQVIAFDQDIPDKEYPYILCSMWGVIPTNEIFVRLTNGDVSFVASVVSPLELPSMADRLFGMDVDDANAAGSLADELWNRHKDELIRAKTA
jgi:hypothetical protein